MKSHWVDVEELARKVLSLPDDSDSYAVDRALVDRFDISFEQFHKIVDTLIPFTLPAKSAITDEVSQGFVDGKFFIVKVPVPVQKGGE